MSSATQRKQSAILKKPTNHSENMNNKFLKYAATICGGIAVSLIILFYNDVFESTDKAYIVKCISDALLAPAAVYLGISALHAISLWGTFDMLAYSTRNFFRLFRRGMVDENLPKDFYEYQKSKSDRTFEVWNLLYPGVAFLVLSVFFAVLHTTL